MSGCVFGLGVEVHVTLPGDDDDDGVAFTPTDAYPVAIRLHTRASLNAQPMLDEVGQGHGQRDT